VHRFEPASGSDRTIDVGSSVGAVALRIDGTLLAALADRLAVLDPDSGALETRLTFESGPRPLRCNDGKPDAAGRFWIGRMGLDEAPGAGSLLLVEPRGRMTTVLPDLTVPNGIGWSPDGRTMYYVDSAWRQVRAFTFEPSTGELGVRWTLVDFPDDGSVPDGLCVDSEGCLWVARWGAGCVVRVSPDGLPLDRVDLPVSQPSSCAFGGPDLADLYITSAREGLGPESVARQPLAGSLFRCRPGVRGLPPDVVAL
jgi:sugar lactone lactonase YvrE